MSESYYICSPRGRTGSQRIFYPLVATVNPDQVIQLTADSLDNIFFNNNGSTRDEFKNIVFTHKINGKEVGEKNILNCMNSSDKQSVVHSHNTRIIPNISENWNFILSERKNKLDSIFSEIIFHRKRKFGKVEPFESKLTENILIEWLSDIDKQNDEFINNVIKLTGKKPQIIYLEDSWLEVQTKLGVDFTSEANALEYSSLSKDKAKDCVLNYQEICEMYNSRRGKV